MLIKAHVKKAFHDNNVQISQKALELLDEDIKRKVHLWARRAKEGNIARLKPSDIYLVLGNPWKKIID
tara:strand:+ start:210 stop:413 length:204 start_codon:yes stop_codon:yes gene_type:complete